jgi:hypothetical protein
MKKSVSPSVYPQLLQIVVRPLIVWVSACTLYDDFTYTISDSEFGFHLQVTGQGEPVCCIPVAGTWRLLLF